MISGVKLMLFQTIDHHGRLLKRLIERAALIPIAMHVDWSVQRDQRSSFRSGHHLRLTAFCNLHLQQVIQRITEEKCSDNPSADQIGEQKADLEALAEQHDQASHPCFGPARHGIAKQG